MKNYYGGKKNQDGDKDSNKKGGNIKSRHKFKLAQMFIETPVSDINKPQKWQSD